MSGEGGKKEGGDYKDWLIIIKLYVCISFEMWF